MATVSANELSLEKTLEELITEFNSLRGDVSSVTLETLLTATSGQLTFEGATDDAYETSVVVEDPTADRTITLPNVTGTVVTTANADAGATTTTIGDLDNFLIDDDGVLKKMSLSTVASNLPAITPASADGAAIGSASKEWSDIYLADGGVIYLGADQDVSLTHVADTGILLNSTMAIQFNDSSQYINAPSNAILDINATDEVEVNATLMDVNANLDVSGTYTGGGLMTTGGNIVIPNAGNIGSASDTNAISISSGGVVAVTATTANTSASDGALTVAGGLGVAADASVGDDLRLISDAAVLSFGANSDVTLTHVHDTGILLNSTMAIQFNDASQYINAPSNAILDINATDEIELNATLADVNANLDVSGTYTGGGLMTTGGNIVIPNAGNIGSASDTDAMSISSGGVVNFSARPTFAASLTIQDGGSVGSASDLNAVTISSGGVVAVTATTANTSASDGALTVAGGLGVAADASIGDDLRLISDASVLSFGANSDVTLTHVHDTGILLNSTMAIQFNDASQYINAPSNAILDINATDEIELNATLADVNANLDVSGTYTGGGLMTTGGNIVIPNAGNIGSASDTDAVAISSAGVVALSATTEASATGTAALTLAGGLGVAKDIWVGDDIVLDSDAAIIKFGDNQDVTLTHVADVGLTITHVGTGDNLPVVLQLKSEEDALVADEVIASLEFAAGDDSGTDAAVVAAGIHAVAEGTFSASANATKLVFTTGVSETAASSATAKMTLSSAGLLTIADDLVIKDGGTIGVASDADSITIDASGNITASQNLTVSGNLTVTGTTTQVDTVTMNAQNAVVFEGATADGNETTLTIVDPTADHTQYLINQGGYIPVLAAVTTTAITSTPAELNILDDATVTTAELNLIDGGTARGTTAVASGDGILINDAGTMRMTNVDTVSTYFASHSVGGGNIVTTGALDSGSITSGFGAIDNGTSGIRTNTFTAETSVVPSAQDGAALGTSSLQFSDLFLADAAVIGFGDDVDVTLTHVADVGLTITHVGTGDNLPVVLQLKSEEDALVADEVIASLEFAAGDSDGTDAAVVAAGIHAIAEDTFSASANATKLVFTAGVSETAAASATAKMTLSSAGLLTLADDLIIKNSGTIGTAADSDLLTMGSGNLTVAGTVTATAGATFLIKNASGSTLKTIKGMS